MSPPIALSAPLVARDFLADLKETTPDCLVLDLVMEGMTGLELQRTLRGMGIYIPTVIITGSDEPEICEQLLQLGVSACLLKPLNRHTLLDAVAEATSAPWRQNAADGNHE